MATASVAAKTVIVADDTAFVRDRFRTALEAAGHHAVAVSTASELLTLLRAPDRRVDLVVLDLRLPPTSGVGLVKAIRAIGDGRLPVLVFSGTIAHADEVRELASCGVVGYVNEYSSAQNIVPALAPHLFPDNFNRRGSPRVILGIPIQYRYGNTIAAALTLNLSRGGIAVRTTSPLELGAALKLRFRMPGSPGDIDAEGRVVWSDRRLGMGIQFERVDAAAQTVIDDFVDAHFFSSRRA
jgi:uncharacterized protein (TIGR02266 family)